MKGLWDGAFPVRFPSRRPQKRNYSDQTSDRPYYFVPDWHWAAVTKINGWRSEYDQIKPTSEGHAIEGPDSILKLGFLSPSASRAFRNPSTDYTSDLEEKTKEASSMGRWESNPGRPFRCGAISPPRVPVLSLSVGVLANHVGHSLPLRKFEREDLPQWVGRRGKYPEKELCIRAAVPRPPGTFREAQHRWTRKKKERMGWDPAWQESMRPSRVNLKRAVLSRSVAREIDAWFEPAQGSRRVYTNFGRAHLLGAGLARRGEIEAINRREGLGRVKTSCIRINKRDKRGWPVSLQKRSSGPSGRLPMTQLAEDPSPPVMARRRPGTGTPSAKEPDPDPAIKIVASEGSRESGLGSTANLAPTSNGQYGGRRGEELGLSTESELDRLERDMDRNTGGISRGTFFCVPRWHLARSWAVDIKPRA
ncbi:hypothetical protein FB45DRAFT_1102646 [Roridomyces roridus]|uniref:Uncharacterized protein n=1 Tax=Roridomyces roridus TaxID=1738132 RepID=A0AAD7G166_9AGAR|nr:hypothetical protein FB45DRAFT_1102646 [Roridomyces roridus]